MLILGLIFLLLTALFGLMIISGVFKHKPTSKPAVFLHGMFALFSLLVLASYVAAGHDNILIISSLALFILAALGGLAMLMIDLSKKPVPKALAVFHPLIALIALALLIVYFVQVV